MKGSTLFYSFMKRIMLQEDRDVDIKVEEARGAGDVTGLKSSRTPTGR